MLKNLYTIQYNILLFIQYCSYWWKLLSYQARRIAEIINSGIQPLQNLSTLKKIGEVTDVDSKKLEWAQHFIIKGFQGMCFLLCDLFLTIGPCSARGHCRIRPPRFLAESHRMQLKQGSFVSAVCLVVYFLWFVLCLCVYFCDLYWVFCLLFFCQ